MRTLALLFALTLSCLAQPLSPNDPAFLQSTSPLRRGLVGYWRLEEASGTRYDCSSTGAHLTANNSPGNAAGKQGNCMTLVAGSLQRTTASTTNIFQFSTNQAFSVSAWVIMTNNFNYQFIIGKFKVPQSGWQVYTDPSGHLNFDFESLSGNKQNLVTGNHSIVDSTWHHIVSTCDGSNTTNGMALYVDGSPESLTGSFNPTVASLANTTSFSIGGRDDLANYFNGMIDEFGIWTRVLTAGELTQLYNAGLGTHFPWAHP